MTNAERNVLVALMHPANSVNHAQADAIRSALREIDALNEALGAERSRVMNLVSRITGKPGDTTNESVGEASREALALREKVADLESRAIPNAWMGTTLEIRSFAGKAITDVAYIHEGRVRVKRIGPEGTSVTEHPTLRDALAAAAKETP